MPGLGPTQLITDVARMSWLDGKKITNSWRRGGGSNSSLQPEGTQRVRRRAGNRRGRQHRSSTSAQI